MHIADQVNSLVAWLDAQGESFAAIRRCDWIAAVEAKFNRRLPVAYRCLAISYRFPEFQIGGITVFSNLNDGSAMDITVAPFADPFMSPWLVSRGYIQFGRRDEVNYDPVCFDFSVRENEPPVVVLDHEDILLERKRVRVQPLANSFLQLSNQAS